MTTTAHADSPTGVLDAVREVHSEITDLEIRKLQLAVDWAVMHPVESIMHGDWPVAVLLAAAAPVLLFRRTYPVRVAAAVGALELAVTFLHPWGSNVSAGLWFALYAVAEDARDLIDRLKQNCCVTFRHNQLGTTG